MEEEVFSFDVNFQKKLLKLMLDDVNFLVKSHKYIKANYFETEILRWIYSNFIKYYESYNKVCTNDVFIQEIMELSEDKNKMEYLSVVKDITGLVVNEKEYIIQKVEEWIKRSRIKPRLENAVTLYNSSRIDACVDETLKAVEDYNEVSFASPHRVNFFEEVDYRVTKRNSRESGMNYRFTSGNLDLDVFIGGGLSRGELGVVVGDAKAGKSIFLLNAGAANIRGFPSAKVLHINLEGKDSQVEDRYDARLLDVPYRDVIRNNLPQNFKQQYKSFSGQLIVSNLIKRWDYTVLDIEQEIIDLRAGGFEPDIVIVDYGDLLKPRKADSSDKYQGQEEVFRDLKTLANKYNCVVWTASQVHRIDAKLGKPELDNKFIYTRRNLADCYAKVRVADLLFTLNITDDERRNKKMRGYLDAYRDAECGQIITYSIDYERMKSYVPSNTVIHKMANM
jgi:replicative DNA helicase